MRSPSRLSFNHPASFQEPLPQQGGADPGDRHRDDHATHRRRSTRPRTPARCHRWIRCCTPCWRR